jgi:23S rRNA (adenine2503-C2)-methyltransferase
MATAKRLIYDLDLQDITGLMQEWHEPAYRALQVWQGIYHHFWQEAKDFTTLPGHLREHLLADFSFCSLAPTKSLKSNDGETVKVLFQLPDKQAIETVLMLYEERRTLCISTQVGCAMGCVFCATGQMGYKRNLTSGEIVEQVIYFARLLNERGERVTNVVVMGMGEPFHNYDATLAAIDRLNNPDGFDLGARRFTISTVGLIPKIRQFADEKRQVNLAISLHAANDPLRATLLPIDKKYQIEELIDACRYYVEQTGRRITFEWALIQGVNDSPEDARQLFDLVKGLLCHVNVIPLNPTNQYHGQATTRQRAEAFCGELEKAGIPCTIRIRRGIDIQAGCGQLASNE